MDTYDTLPGIRRSDLWEIRKTPLHFIKRAAKVVTPALKFGIAAHMALLEPLKFDETYAVEPTVDKRTREGRRQYNAFLDTLHEGQEPISQQDYDTIRDMRYAVLEHPTAAELLTGFYPEQVYQWLDPETGELCKMKADIVTNYNGKPYLVDYKTTASCADGDFEHSAKRYGYHMQAAMYSEGYFANTYTEPGFAFLAQEKTEPYAVRVYFCDPYFVEQGREEYHRLMQIYHHCKERNEWPGYPDAELLGE